MRPITNCGDTRGLNANLGTLAEILCVATHAFHALQAEIPFIENEPLQPP